MHNRFTKRGLTTLLLLALLIVGVALVLTFVSSADPESKDEMDDFYCQTLTDLDLANPDEGKTALRFLCTIGSLDYKEAGFVFSKTNTLPTIGGGGCQKAAVTAVHGSIMENGTPRSAGEERYWVAIKLVKIPHAYFDGPIYVTAYVIDTDENGGATRYSDTHVVSVCSAEGHTHTVSTPDYTIPASVLSNQKKVGLCAGCNLDNVIQTTGESFSARELKFKKNGGAGYTNESFDPNVKFSTVRGEDHFYPTEGYPKGKDFYFEIDLLWNSTIANSPDDEFHLLIWNSDYSGEGDKYNNIFLLAPKDDAAGCYCKFAGGFDYGAGTGVLDGPDAGNNQPWENYPNIESVKNADDFGWHRIGVRLHQEAEIVAGNVVYSGVAYLYIDGLQRWAIQLDMAKLSSKSNLLFIASIDPEDATKLKYDDNDGNRYFDFWAPNLKNSETEIDMVFRPATARLVDPATFDTGVMPVYDPPSVPDYTLPNGSTTCAKVYFTEKTTVNLFDSKNPTGHPYYDDSETNAFVVSKSLADIQGGEHFYPTPEHPDGQDLFFEYSMYWNPSLANWSNKNGTAEAKAIVFRHDPNNQTTQEPFIFYTKAGQSSDCPFAGHFDFSGMSPSSSACVLWGDMYSGYAPAKYGRAKVEESDSPSIGGYGWHRIGIRVHQEAEIEEGAVKYSGWSELHIDGSMVWRIGLNVDNAHTRGYELFNASIDPEDSSKLVYSDNASAYPTLIQMRFENFVYASDDTVYFAIDDPIWTIGSDFIHPTHRFH